MIIDCATTIEPHWKWPSYNFVSQSYDNGDEFQEFGLKWIGNGFSFVTSPGWRTPGGKRLDDYPLDRFAAVAAVIDLTGIGDRAVIVRALLDSQGEIGGRSIAVLKSGFAERISNRKVEYWSEAPSLAEDIANWCAAAGVGLLVVDFPCDEGASVACHRRLDALDVLLVQNAKGLSALRQSEVFFAALPLRLPDGTTSPVRPIALTEWPSNRPRFLDVSVPLGNHWRWKLDVFAGPSFAKGDDQEEVHFVFGGHGFTHFDAPCHMERDGATVQQLPNWGLDQFIKSASLIDLSDIPLPSPVTKDLVQARGGHVRKGDLIILRSDLTNRVGYPSREWHLKAPNLEVPAAEWLTTFEPAAICLDFPQDFVAREMPERFVANNEFVAHHAILGKSIPFVEDLRDLGEIGDHHCFLMAVPLKMTNLDSAPMRVVAVEW
ncbi:MAG: cyclase family protein [Geminicoccaceae bacterium]